jgi:uncharacterized phage-associated protein
MEATCRAVDVAAYILTKQTSMTAMKLQKLVYYSQAWSLVWDERPLFAERIEAWANGPVVPELYNLHRGKFQVTAADLQGEPTRLDNLARETVDSVLASYGDKTSQWLSDLTHAEKPWLEARGNLSPSGRSNTQITDASMMEYYSGLR